MKKSQLLLLLFIVLMLGFTVLVLVLMNIGVIPTIFDKDKGSSGKTNALGLIDDWCYEYDGEDTNVLSSIPSGGHMDLAMSPINSSESIGLSVGGAKDISNFRENIENGYFPLQSDITYEGIFYDYSFDTGNEGKSNDDKLFYPTYTTSISKDPFSEKDEYYVSVGLNSNIKEEDFSRKKLNLMIVLDISGSMDSTLTDYFYDPKNVDEYEENENKSKMELAEESINVLLDQLNPEDSVGIVLFDDEAYLAKPMNLVGDTDIESIKEHILEVGAAGGTNFEAGLKLANEQIEEYGIKDTNEYENRFIVITDAMPNIGETSSDSLRGLLENNSEKGVYTSFIGVGVDFNTEVVKNITDIKGANYYSVSSEKEFKTRMGDEFEYMVTPLAFDLDMSIESDGFEVENIYGTDSLSSENDGIMHVNTLFPSATNDEGEVKGGIILLKLNKTKEDANSLKLNVSYVTRQGDKESASETVEFKKDDNYYDNTGIRKGILLARFVNVIKNWIEYEREENDRYLITVEKGIFDCIIDEDYNSENERTSVELTVSDKYKEIFDKFSKYFKEEADEIGDEDLSQELDILDTIKNT